MDLTKARGRDFAASDHWLIKGTTSITLEI
jgi:hypothetical protein